MIQAAGNILVHVVLLSGADISVGYTNGCGLAFMVVKWNRRGIRQQCMSPGLFLLYLASPLCAVLALRWSCSNVSLWVLISIFLALMIQRPAIYSIVVKDLG